MAGKQEGAQQGKAVTRAKAEACAEICGQQGNAQQHDKGSGKIVTVRTMLFNGPEDKGYHHHIGGGQERLLTSLDKLQANGLGREGCKQKEPDNAPGLKRVLRNASEMLEKDNKRY